MHPPTSEAPGGEDPQTDFERVVHEHLRFVHGVLLGHLGPHEVEDAAQEVFLRAYRGLEAFEGRSQMRTWLYRIATNVAISRLRRRGRRPAPASLSEQPEEVPGAPNAPDEGLLAEERRRAVLDAIQELPDFLRDVVVLRGLQGLSFNEVAELLSIKRPTAESRMARAKERLRVRLREWLGDLLGPDGL